MNPAIIVSAPSGAGKTTIVKHLLQQFPRLEFSISACSRARRTNETDGKDYYFIPADEFREKIERAEFVEWQEVYTGSFYGTLKSELERIWAHGNIPIFDVDVFGGMNLKKYFGDDALSIFIRPPSMEILEARLRKRGSDTEESIRRRLDKVEEEISYAGNFDRIVVNDEISTASEQATILLKQFLNGK